MGIRFNADEILAMAEQVEERGAEFYRRAAELLPAAPQTARLRELAAEEDRHREIFAAMRRALPPEARESTAHDPYMEATMFLQDMADAHGGEGSPDAAKSLTGRESLADVLRIAIDLERKSILFYLGLRDMVPARLGRDQVDAVIAEEKAHLATLASDLRKPA